MRFFLQFAGQRLDIPASAQRVGDGGDAAFLGQDQLRVAGDAGGEIGRKRHRLVEAVGVERLGPAEHRGQRLDRGADDVVVGVLFGQRHTRRLAVGAEQLGLFGFGAEIGHDPRPQSARRAQLGDLHEQVHADPEKEGQARREGVDVEPLRRCGADIFHAVGQREGELLHRGRPRLVHVIAADRDRVEPGHFAGRVSNDVRDDPHRRLGRVDVGVADREFFQDVVLDGAAQRRCRHPLLLARDDVEGHDRQHRAVHGHADRHLAQRNAVEQQFHVLDAVDRDPGLADIARHARMVAVVAAVGGEVEGDAQALLPGGKVAAIEGVRFLGGREAGILADGPGPTRIHGRIRPAGVGRDAGIAGRDPRGILRAIDGLEPDPLGRRAGKVGAARFLCGERFPGGLHVVVGHGPGISRKVAASSPPCGVPWIGEASRDNRSMALTSAGGTSPVGRLANGSAPPAR